MAPVRTAVALGFALVALAGCGGGSDDTAPPPTASLAAPANFKVVDFSAFRWDATPGATRYELHADPDGSGPLAEFKVSDHDKATGSGFRYESYTGERNFNGSFSGIDGLKLPEGVNASYRLRACDASGCGAFTAAKAYDIVNAVSHAFPSGYAPLDQVQMSPLQLSKDGLTLAVGVGSSDADFAVSLFGRASSSQPWQPQALLRSGKGGFRWSIRLSADGATLAVQAREPDSKAPGEFRYVVYTYQRSGNTWGQQASLDVPGAPSACPAPCHATTRNLALSADGNLLVWSMDFQSTSAGGDSTSMGAVATYIRNGTTWSQQTLLETGGKAVDLLALSGDGRTLAVNQGAFYRYAPPQTPYVLVFTQQSNGTWSQQARIPVGIAYIQDIAAGRYSTMNLSDDGNTLAVLARNSPGFQPPELDLSATDLSCGPMAGGMYMALFARTGSAWQRQAAISRGYSTSWALASDGNALFYGNALFTRSNGAWACP